MDIQLTEDVDNQYRSETKEERKEGRKEGRKEPQDRSRSTKKRKETERRGRLDVGRRHGGPSMDVRRGPWRHTRTSARHRPRASSLIK